MPKNKMISVRWRDSTSWDNWRSLPLDDSELIVIETVGYVIEETDDRVVVAHSGSSAKHCHGLSAIPKSTILNRRKIKNA
jgi:hypothetical protein